MSARAADLEALVRRDRVAVLGSRALGGDVLVVARRGAPVPRDLAPCVAEAARRGRVFDLDELREVARQQLDTPALRALVAIRATFPGARLVPRQSEDA